MSAVTTRARVRGVSLIEALVALAVMAFGILGVVGMQATLRANADVSRQRAEAVRIAQEAIENWRGYSVLEVTSGQTAYDDIADAADLTITGTNATFTLRRQVEDAQETSAAEPRRRALMVDVSWPDRTGQTQSVLLKTTISGVAPELAGSLGVSANTAATQQPGGRNPLIPAGAQLNTGADAGTSTFELPGTNGGVRWFFNNATGVITRICSPGCVNTQAFLLAGYVRFALGTAQPTPADAETPVGFASLALGVTVSVTSTSPASTVACFEEPQPQFVAYYCAIPVPVTLPVRWAGKSTIVTSTAYAGTPFDPTVHRVCRYTPGRDADTNGDNAPDGDLPPNGNVDHPLNYANVTGSLANQNFLVLGDLAFTCPGDDTSTPLLNGNTWQHQPHT